MWEEEIVDGEWDLFVGQTASLVAEHSRSNVAPIKLDNTASMEEGTGEDFEFEKRPVNGPDEDRDRPIIVKNEKGEEIRFEALPSTGLDEDTGIATSTTKQSGAVRSPVKSSKTNSNAADREWDEIDLARTREEAADRLAETARKQDELTEVFETTPPTDQPAGLGRRLKASIAIRELAQGYFDSGYYDDCWLRCEQVRPVTPALLNELMLFKAKKDSCSAKRKEVSENFGKYSVWNSSAPPPREMLNDLKALGIRTGDKKENELIKDAECEVLRYLGAAVIGDPQWKERQEQRADLFAALAASDKKIGEAHDKWSTYSDEDKIAICNRIASHMSSALEMDECPKVKQGRASDDTPGFYSRKTRSIEIALGTNDSLLDMGGGLSFKGMCDTITHETTHAWQHELCVKLDNGEAVDPEDLLAVEAFRANFFEDRYSDDFGFIVFKNQYMEQPVEMDAHFMGPTAAQALIAKLKAK